MEPRLQHASPIWGRSPRSRAQIVRRVCEALERTYGRPRLGNPHDSVDDLVYIVISNRTSAQVAADRYLHLKRTFPTWDELLASDGSDLFALLERAGLATIKTNQIMQGLAQIAADFGSCSLSALAALPESEIESYLLSLPGVSTKVAKCVMMYTMGKAVLPVDGHVYRVAKRLGWTVRMRADQCHEELEALVPPHRRYAFHVDCIAHGRSVCHPRRPHCSDCAIARHCLVPARSD